MAVVVFFFFFFFPKPKGPESEAADASMTPCAPPTTTASSSDADDASSTPLVPVENSCPGTPPIIRVLAIFAQMKAYVRRMYAILSLCGLAYTEVVRDETDELRLNYYRVSEHPRLLLLFC